MIAFLKGTIEEINEKSILLDVGGVGYEIFMPSDSASKLSCTGEEVKIHTFLQTGENGTSLYGFLTKDELQIFKLLITVNGIGPKGAVGILSVMSAADLRLAVLAEDDKAIAKAPGIGPKTAKKVILELKDKFHLEDTLTGFSDFPERFADVGNKPAAEANFMEAVQALTALGYSNCEALKAVRAVKGGETMEVEELLKAALKMFAFL